MGDSSSRYTFHALDTWRILVGSTSDEGVASSFAHFFSIYIWRILLILSISSVSLSVVILKAVLLQKANLPINSISFFFHIFAYN